MSAFSIARTTPESRIAAGLAAITIAALAFAPWWMDRNSIRIAGEMLVYIGLASLWNLLAGYGGLVSVGQHAFVGLGAYALFGFCLLLNIPPLAAVPLAGVIAALLAAPVSLLVFRLRGAYFAIGTWVVAEVFRLSAAQVTALGGGSGVSLPIAIVRSIGASKETREFFIYDATLALALAILAGILLVTRSRWGLALQAMRDSEIAAETCGVDVARAKRVIYIAAASGAAMLGALISLAKLRITPDSAFSVNDWTAYVIFITVIGGIGRFEGPIVGTILFFILRESLADLGPVYLIALGLVAVAVMLFAPKGVYGFVAERFDLQLFPIARRVTIAPDAPSADSP